jgi:predicted RNA-binding Zn ribbon-like protein
MYSRTVAREPSWDWLGDHLAVDLANTVRRHRGGERELLAEPGDLAAWLRHEAGRVPVPGVIDEPLTARVRDLRDHALAVLRATARRAPAPPASVAALNAIVVAWPSVRTLGTTPGSVETRVLNDPRPGEALLATLAAAVVDLHAGPDGTRLALCDAPSCGQLFLRARAQQRWCGPGCGNRVRAARHHRRARGR